MLVEGLIPRGSITVIAGPTYSGKTFFALELARAAALGEPFMGQFPILPHLGNVLLVEQDSPAYDTGYALRRMLPPWFSTDPERAQTVPLYVSWHPGLNLQQAVDVSSLISSSRSLSTSLGLFNTYGFDEDTGDFYQEHEEQSINGCSLLILDTLHSLHHADENSNTEMGVILSSIKRLRDQTGASILIVHHAGRSKLGPGYAPTVRGATAIENAVDNIFQISRNKRSGLISVHVEKARSIQPPNFTYTISSRDDAGIVTKHVTFKSFLQAQYQEDDTHSPDTSAKDLFMSFLSTKSEHRRSDLTSWASLNGVTDRTVTNWIMRLLETGKLLRSRQGRETTYTVPPEEK